MPLLSKLRTLTALQRVSANVIPLSGFSRVISAFPFGLPAGSGSSAYSAFASTGATLSHISRLYSTSSAVYAAAASGGVSSARKLVGVPHPRIYGGGFTAKGPLAGSHFITVKLIHDALSEAQQAALAAVAAEHGLAVGQKHETSTDVSGSHTAISALLGGVHLTEFTHPETDPSHTLYSHTDEVVIPESLPFVHDVLGLNNLKCARPYKHKQSTWAKAHAVKPSALASITPTILANLYGFPPGTGAGQVIGMIELGGGFVQSDLTHYFTTLGLNPQPTVQAVGVAGATNNPADKDSSEEVVLDIEVGGAIANGSTIKVYFAPNTDAGFYAAIQQAITDKVNIISISWGGPEKQWSSSTMTSFDKLFATAAAKGINAFVAAGDNGSSDGLGGSQALNVDFPSSSPNVVSCGGTKVITDGRTITSETVWNDNNGAATGGGYSAVFSKPAYQANTLDKKQAKRGVPDITGNADPVTGYPVFLGGKTAIIGGTSAVAPLYAGLAARIQGTKGHGPTGKFWNPVLYTAGSAVCVDITKGTNVGFPAGTGWDPASGLGRVDGTKFLGKV